MALRLPLDSPALTLPAFPTHASMSFSLHCLFFLLHFTLYTSCSLDVIPQGNRALVLIRGLHSNQASGLDPQV